MSARVALVGVFGHGAHHLRELASLEAAGEVRLVAAADPRVEQAELPAGVRRFPSLDALLAGVEVDVVIIVTPIPTHLELAGAALEVGCDVLLEKPPVASMEQFDALRAAEEASDGVVQVGFQSLGSDGPDAIRDLVADGAIGRVRGIGASGTWVRPRAYWARAPWAGRRMLDGREVVDGVVTNPLAHAIATALSIGGTASADDVVGIELDQYRVNDIEADDTSSLRIATRAGISVTAALTLCAADHHEPTVTVHGESGRIVYAYTLDRAELHRDGEEPVVTHYARRSLLSNLVAHRHGGERLLVPLAETGAFMRLMDAVRTAPDPRAIDPAHVDWVGEGDAAHPVLRGVELAVAEATRRGALFRELDLPWSAR